MDPIDGKTASARDESAAQLTRRELLGVAALALVAGVPEIAAAAGPAGQLTWGIHVSMPPTWFDPAETQGIITPFMVLYALHDAMVKPMPGNGAVAESARRDIPHRDVAIVAARHQELAVRAEG